MATTSALADRLKIAGGQGHEEINLAPQVCAHIYTCIHVYICAYIRIYIFIDTYIYIFRCVCVSICMYISIYVCICMYIYVCKITCIRIHIYTYIYTYIRTSLCVCEFVCEFVCVCACVDEFRTTSLCMWIDHLWMSIRVCAYMRTYFWNVSSCVCECVYIFVKGCDWSSVNVRWCVFVCV